MRLPNLAALPLLLCASLALAADEQSSLDFDQPVDVSAILENARALAAKQLTSIPLIESEPNKVTLDKHMIAGPGQYQPVSPLIIGSAAYPLGVNLRVDPKYLALDPTVLKPLETDWAGITATRGDLLSQASPWETDNEELYQDGKQLEIDRTDLERRKTDLNIEIGQYNQACTTRPLPPDEYQRCVSWRDVLIKRSSKLETDITLYNGRVTSWNQRSNAIFQRRGTLVMLIEGWERRIEAWIETARRAMAAICRPVDKLESRPAADSVFTGGFTAEFEVRAFFKAEPKDAPPCPVEYLWTLEQHPPDPSRPIGNITPRNGPKTVFKSSNYTGIGTIVVQELNSGVGTGSTINVRDASR